MTDMPIAAPGSAGVDFPANSIEYDGKAGPMAGLVLKTTLMTILTLGIYRFWAKTRIRRFLWTHVSFRGERLEYTGRGIELFLGFLIVIGLVLGLTVIQTVAEWGLSGVFPYIGVVLSVAYVLLLIFLVPVAQYRARRYRLSRTQWRGVRAGQGGSSVRYGFAALGYQVLSMLTLGLISPLMRVRLFARRMNETWFGDRKFWFDGLASDLFPAWMTVWIPQVVTTGLYAYIIFLLWDDMSAATADIESNPQASDAPLSDLSLPDVPVWVPFALGLSIVLSLIAYVRYWAIEYRYLVKRTTFENLGFSSTLGAWKLFWIYLPYVLVMAVILLATVAAFGGVATMTDPQAAGLMPLAVAAVFIVVGPVLRYVLVINRMAGLLCTTLSIEGEQDFEAILQSAHLAPKRGEGLAEFLDVSDF